MEKINNKIQASKVIKTSKKTQSKLSVVADKLKGKDLFADKIELARKSLSDVSTLPI